MTTDPTPCPKCGKTHPGCRAHNRAGEPCGRARIVGSEVCYTHGGATRQVKVAALATVQRADIQRTLAGKVLEPISDPVTAYRELAGEVWAFKEEARRRLDALTEWQQATYGPTGEQVGEQERAAVTTYVRSIAEAEKVLHNMAKLGLTEAYIRELERAKRKPDATVILAAITRVLDRLAVPVADRPALIADALEAS